MQKVRPRTEPLATAGARCVSIAALASLLCFCSSDMSRPAGRAMAETCTERRLLAALLLCLAVPDNAGMLSFRHQLSMCLRLSRTAIA